MSPQERSLLESLDAILRSEAIRARIDPIVARVAHALELDRVAPMAFEPIPLSLYGVPLPPPLQSSWVFILRAGATTGAERHPNSQQRMTSYRGSGDLQTGGEGHWQSHKLVSADGAGQEERWISVPPGVWHQAVVPDQDWVVVSFHTVRAEDLIEERPVAAGRAAVGIWAAQRRSGPRDRPAAGQQTKESAIPKSIEIHGFLCDERGAIVHNENVLVISPSASV
jgi:hypothetical protein